jgi:preprotein translocase subunit SecG
MLAFVTILHVILCVFMIFVILLQPGKDAGMGAALGGGAATSAFGGRGGATFLSKVTAISAALFFLTSLGLSFVGLKSSVATDAAPPPKKTATAVPDGGMTTPPKTLETMGGETTASGDAGTAVQNTASGDAGAK